MSDDLKGRQLEDSSKVNTDPKQEIDSWTKVLKLLKKISLDLTKNSEFM